MKVIHKEIFTFTPNNKESEIKAKSKSEDLKNCGYKVNRQTTITGITIIGSKTTRYDETGNELYNSGGVLSSQKID